MGSNVIRQTIISPIQFTNFLSQGAILRRGESWLLFELGPKQKNRPDLGSNKSEISISYMDFYDQEMQSLVCRNVYHLNSDQLESLILQHFQLSPQVKSHRNWMSPRLGDFQQAFQEIQSKIDNQLITKAVPAVFLTSDGGAALANERCQLLLSLLKAPKNLYPYGLWEQDKGVIGATPELLFEREAGLIKTMALAGTRRRGDGSIEEFIGDQKELSEHNFVVADLVAQLRSIGEVRCQPMSVLELPHLWHLQTKIEVEMKKEISDVEIVQKLNPTPALGVAPRSFGYRWMQELPGQQRRHSFGAPILFSLADEEAICLVSIRNVQWDHLGWILGSGCGVVKESVLEKEWRELFFKRESVLKLFGLECEPV